MATPWWIDFVAGWCSGATSLLLCQPLDTILTRQQAHVKVDSTLLTLSQHPLVTSTTTTTHTSWMPKTANWMSLWRGVSPMIGAVPIQNALLMSGYGMGKRWFDDYSSNKLLWGVFIGGCVGGILQSFLMSPVELLKITQQVYRQNMSTALVTLRNGTSKNIWKSPLWKGLGATLWRDGIPHGVWFASYEFLKNRLDGQLTPEDSIHLNRITFYHSMLSGAFAATCAWLVGVRGVLNSKP